MTVAGLMRLFRRQTDDEPENHGLLLATVFLTVWLAFGTVGYAALEEWPLMDALYMAFITLTTIGFGEIHTLSTAGRLFTIVFAFVGIGSVAYVAARWKRLLLASQLMRQRQRARRIRSMRDHFIMCGYGRIGRQVAADLLAADRTIVVLDTSVELTRELHEQGVPAIHGDATDEDILIAAGITRARGLITALPADSMNVFVTLVARELNGELFILARTNDERNRRKMLQAGATHVVAPSNVGALRMAQVILRPNVDRFLSHIMKANDLGLIMEEVRVEPGSFLAGKTLSEAKFRQHFDAIVVTVIRGADMEMRFNPGSQARIHGGDMLIVLGNHEMVARLEKEGCSAA